MQTFVWIKRSRDIFTAFYRYHENAIWFPSHFLSFFSSFSSKKFLSLFFEANNFPIFLTLSSSPVSIFYQGKKSILVKTCSNFEKKFRFLSYLGGNLQMIKLVAFVNQIKNWPSSFQFVGLEMLAQSCFWLFGQCLAYSK